MLKKNLLKVAAISIISVLILGLGFTSIMSQAPAQAAENSADRGALNVNGTAIITGTPDIAYITLGVETRDPSAEDASQENAARMAKVIAELKELGLEEKDITTSNYNVYSYQQNRSGDSDQNITVYTIQNRINITTKDLDSVGRIIDVAIQSGANQVQGIRFDIEDKQEMQLQALQNATKQARTKAEAIAESAGVAIGGIKVITENTASYAPYVETFAVRANSLAAADTTINPGDVEVSANVTVEFWF